MQAIAKAYNEAEQLKQPPSENWELPVSLPSTLPDVPSFDPYLLPANLRPWIVDICDRMHCPLDFAAIPAMVAVGSLVGKRVGIRPEAHTDWTEVANLWGCIVGRPGAMKSPVISEVLGPIKRLEARAMKRNEEARAEFSQREAINKLQNEEAKKRIRKRFAKDGAKTSDISLDDFESLEPPIEQRFMTTDATVEKLGVICADNPNGVLLYRDELLTMFQDLDREEKAASRGFFLTGWSGSDSYTFDRIGRGTVRVETVNLSVIGSAQPHRIGKYLKESLRTHDDGMVQRLQLLAWPDHDTAWRSADRYPNVEAKTKALACFDRLADLKWSSVGADRDDFDDGSGVPFLRFEQEALEEFVDWRMELEDLVRGDTLPPYLAAHLSKFRGLVPRLALIWHLASDGFGPVSVEACGTAIEWAAYLRAHAERAYDAMSLTNTDTANAILQKIRAGDLKAGFTERDVYRPGWSGLRDRDANKAALALLADHDWVRPKRVETGGRPSTEWDVNPKISGN
ncbi:YfjI family protein [Sphingomicrobium astaxanthinifaciens]|uniref:YfjI family protein n=1 Tax=Sphingomicrobium astaxanthinifaciens TaxID=1227949 RepID=UPI001FCB96B2|nr:YfjI family protein [Sphingomicrobium astaxanthinifaciens]MCJ7420947.1 DUF3987 domain-containing protein [Sphingomicrobium astaxanthinifaciens]